MKRRILLQRAAVVEMRQRRTVRVASRIILKEYCSTQRRRELFTRHPPPATRHPPPVTRYPLPVTRYPPPVTRYSLRRYPLPATRYPWKRPAGCLFLSLFNGTLFSVAYVGSNWLSSLFLFTSNTILAGAREARVKALPFFFLQY